MNRRKFLSYTLGTGVVLTSSLLTLSLQGTTMVPPSQPLLCVTEKEYAILFAVAEILIPNNPPFPPASAVDVAHKVDAVLGRAHKEQQEQFSLVLALIENPSVSTLLNAQIHPFTKSTDTEKSQRLASWRTGIPKLRSAFKALNGICNAAYYADSTVEKILGYNGPPTNILEIRRAKGYP